MDIDLVVLWVDGTDPVWLAEKKKYEPDKPLPDGGDKRYRDWGLMPYWFRSIEAFAPWVRKVYFVTWGHVPAFLNTEAPKLQIVRHEDFIPKEYLPTFNSCAIEANLHRLPGLAEHFVYFNDDVFLLQPTVPEDFFRKGMPCAYSNETSIVHTSMYNTWRHQLFNDLWLVNRNFRKREQVKKNRTKYITGGYNWRNNLRTLALEVFFPGAFLGFGNLHGPSSFLRDTYREVWEKEPEALDYSCREKFRNYNQVNQNLFQWWQVAKGTIAPVKLDVFVRKISDESIDRLCETIRQRQHTCVCLQDDLEDGPENIKALSTRLKEAFSIILPHKSQFEV